MKSDWRRALEIFEETCALPAEEREARLRLSCAGDAELFANVQSLLEAQQEEGGFLEREIAGYAGQVAAVKIPERIGAYRVLSEIGRGGMAAVYLAERDDLQYRSRVAIKLVHAGSASHADMRRRFLAERQILASLRHPNIAQLHDGGVTEDGVPYLVMEYVEGLRLDEYCAQNRLPIRRRIELFRQVCSAVQFAHRNLVVHRDLKPSNILVNNEGLVKLLDFGIAKLLRPGEPMQTVALTQPAQRLLTLEYASPEQFRGEAITTAADIYALGVVLYELLAGVYPFEKEAADFLTLQRAICEIDPPAPSAAVRQRDRALAAQLKGDLDQIVLKSVRKEPSARYESAEQLSQDLGRYLDGYPVEARQGKTRYHVGKFVRRHRVGVFGAAAFAALLIAFSISSAMLAARVTRERNQAKQQQDRAEKVSSFLNSMFVGADPIRNGGPDLRARDLLDRGAERLPKELAGEPRVAAELLEAIGQAYKHLGFPAKADEMFRDEAKAVAKGYGPQSEEMGRILRQLADAERLRGDLAGAESDLRASLAILEKLPPDKNAALSHALNNMALVLQAERDLPAAEADFRRAVGISSRYPSEIEETLMMRWNLGLVLMDQGGDAAAEPILRDVLAGRRKVLGEGHPYVATTLRSLATSLANRGRFGEAEALYRQALVMFRAALPADHPNIVLATVLLAGVLRGQGRFAEAETEYRAALAADVRTAGEHGVTAVDSAALASLLFLAGRDREAGQLFNRALNILHNDGGGLRQARVLTQAGTFDTATARYDAAARALDQAREIYRRNPKGTEPETAEAIFQQAELQQVRGNTNDAGTLYAQAIGIDRAVSARARLVLANHLLAYAAFLARNGAGPQAENAAREALAVASKYLPPDAWQLDSANSVLAAALAAQGRYNEAEPLAASAYANLSRKLGAKTRPALAAAVRVASLDRDAGRPAPRERLVSDKQARALCCVY